MRFCDYITLEIHGGHGGRGCLSFFRSKFLPKGGPDGGNGGDGGSIFIKADNNLSDLQQYYNKRILRAENGANGENNNKTGRNGKDAIIDVPVGTQIWENGELLADLDHHEAIFMVAKGGRGGRGNLSFQSFTNRAPIQNTIGESGEEKKIDLQLKLIADVGLIGAPNVGKSSLLAALTGARPEIGDYEFTTLYPNLGVMILEEKRMTIADIPGIVQLAHQGKGLGIRFLQHAERCQMLIAVLDASENYMEQLQIIRKELAQYSRIFGGKLKRLSLAVVNKIDLVQDLEKIITKLNKKIKTVAVSANTGSGLDELKQLIMHRGHK